MKRAAKRQGCRARPRQRGQSSVEYTLILVLVLLVLIEGGPNSPIAEVVTALKDYFGAYSWAISFSNLLTFL
jgi:Flp pilus assembly pilin Flp